ncbi:MAG: fatty acid desaturase [Myxococcales bacterium]|nr:fatty acid desaturase [Myxococcales bacterium]MCB9717590.1 fatty acid desaturase [Myxococcales bacterium]
MAPAPRTGRALILATKPFEEERPLRSWLELLSTFVVYGGCMAAVLASPWPALRIAASVLAGFVQFRMFSLYHDHNHGALLPDSKAGRAVMSAIGVLILTPRTVWKETHNFHHWNNGKLEWTSIGSYPVLTVEQLAAATPDERRKYRRTRHPLAILAGYLTVGIGGMCISAFRRNPKRHWVGPIALTLHLLALAGLAWGLGPLTAALLLVVPITINHALASYLFYAQHNFPETKFFPRGTWDYTEAALHGSSYMVMGPLMRWLTNNIGYHHVHHLNSKIPGYRLPETMAALEELQSPHRTSFSPGDVLACLRLESWDPAEQRMRSASESPSPAPAPQQP